MNERDAMLELLRADRARMDALRGAVGRECGAAVRRYAAPDGTFGPVALSFALRDITKILDRVYGARPGDESGSLFGIIDAGARDGRRLGVELAARRSQRALRRAAPDVYRDLGGA